MLLSCDLEALTIIGYIDLMSLFFQQMLKEQMICHASGDFSHPFIVGFYLYHIVQQEKDQKGLHSFNIILIATFLELILNYIGGNMCWFSIHLMLSKYKYF
jgi:hypothetical protein